MNDKLIPQIITYILAGVGRASIIDILKEESLDNLLSSAECDRLIQQAKQAIQQRISTDQKQIGIINLGRYEQIYNYFVLIGNIKGALKALKAKDRLTGLGYDNKIIINQPNNSIPKRKVVYDESLLSPAELIELQYLYSQIICEPKVTILNTSGAVSGSIEDAVVI